MKVTVKQLVEKRPYLTEASVRWLLFNRAQNGLNRVGAVFKIGKKVLIEDEKWDEWENGHREAV